LRIVERLVLLGFVLVPAWHVLAGGVRGSAYHRGTHQWAASAA
jgi:hypothetical protein